MAGIAEGCRQAGCAILGGELAEHPGQLPEGEMDLAGFAVGVVERDRLLGPRGYNPPARAMSWWACIPMVCGAMAIRWSGRLCWDAKGADWATRPGRARGIPWLTSSCGRRSSTRPPCSPFWARYRSARWPTSPEAAWPATCPAPFPRTRCPAPGRQLAGPRYLRPGTGGSASQHCRNGADLQPGPGHGRRRAARSRAETVSIARRPGFSASAVGKLVPGSGRCILQPAPA